MSAAVSELNGRISLDTSPLARDVPVAIGLLRKLSSAQAEAAKSVLSGPDLAALQKRINDAIKAQGEVGNIGFLADKGAGVWNVKLKSQAAISDLGAQISSLNDESLGRSARRRMSVQKRQALAVDAASGESSAESIKRLEFLGQEIEKVKAKLVQTADASINETLQRRLTMLEAQAVAERKIFAQRLSAEGESQDAHITAYRNAERLLELENKIAQVKSAREYERASPVEREAIEAKKLNDLLAERTRIKNGGGNDEAIAQTTLAIEKQTDVVNRLTEANRAAQDAEARKNAAADAAKAERLLEIESKIAQVKSAREYERASPAEREAIEVKKLNDLLEQRTRLVNSGGDEEAIARTTLAIQNQADVVNRLSEANRAANNSALRERADNEAAKAERLLELNRKIAQVKAAGEYERASPFQRQVIEMQRLNKLLFERRDLIRSGGDAEAIASATLAVQKQTQAVLNLRAALTVGTASQARLGATADDSLKGFARFGLAAQQLGYQVQDFSVQVASGTNALVAFSQQSSQALGFFGGWKGAAAGAAISTGILIYSLVSLDERMKKLKESTLETARVLSDIAVSRYESIDLLDKPLSDQLAYYEGMELSARNTARLQKIIADEATRAAKGSSFKDEAFRQYGYTDESGKFSWAGLRNLTSIGAIISGAKLVTTYATGSDKGAKALEDAIAANEKLAEAERQALRAAQALRGLKTKQGNDSAAAIKDEIGLQKELGEQLRANALIGKDSLGALFARRSQAREQLASLTPQDGIYDMSPQARLDRARALGDIAESDAAIKSMAQSYRDQLDPLSKIRREWEAIDKLVSDEKLSPKEAALLKARMDDDRARAIRAPDALQLSSGAMASGGYVGSGSERVAQQIDRIITILDKISRSTASMAGPN